MLLASGCSVGTGEGRAEGVINVPQCDLVDQAYSLSPSFWGGELVVDDQLELRMQRSGALESASDGLRFLILDPTTIKSELLGAPIDLAALDPFQPQVRLSLYLNETCPTAFDRVRIPVNYESVSGSLTFDAIYAPEIDDQDFRISLHFEGVRLEADMRSDEHYAVIDGTMDFLLNRGRPAQRYP